MNDMKRSFIFGIIFASSVLTVSMSAGPVTLQVNNYNFQLDGGGGGSQATLGTTSVEIFCDDFANEIWVPSTDSANVTQLTGSLDLTRFGQVSSWTTISGTTDDAFFAGSTGSAAATRYDMVAWLVSQYNIAQNGNPTVNAANNQLQEAIWTLMDPAAYATDNPAQPLIDPSGQGQPTADLEAAANWFIGGGATTSFLSQFEVVSDATMTPGTAQDGYVGVGGFQEQIVMATPEPRAGIWVLLGVFLIGACLLRRQQLSLVRQSQR
jgi:hypothetical protein